MTLMTGPSLAETNAMNWAINQAQKRQVNRIGASVGSFFVTPRARIRR